MKIAMYYSCPFETGGIEKTMFQRGKYLKEQGNEITYIFSSNNSQINTLEKWATIGKVRNYEAVKDEVFDCVIYDAIYNLKRVKAIRNNYIQVINGNLIDSGEKYEETIPFKKYVSVSEECARQFKEFKGKESKIIPNLIAEEEIIKLSNEPVDIPKKAHNFVIVSRIDKYKGFDKLETALKKIEKRYNKDYQLVIVGSCNLFNSYVNQLKEQLKQYNVIWAGYQDNPYKFMKWADYLFMFSKSESQCIVMYESLIVGTPCVCTDFKNAIEDLKPNMGYIVNQELSNFKLNEIEKIKKGFEFHYNNHYEDWLEIIKQPEKKDYKFSIIIPNYNNGQYLEKCLKSVLSQTYKNYEIIFIDDKSEDNSLEIAKKLLKQPHKILEVPYKKYNGGTRNIGIMQATGDYIMCIDSDDWLLNDKILENLNNFIEDEDIIRTGYKLYDGRQNDMDKVFTDIPKHEKMYDLFIEPTCAIWTKLVKTEILKNTLFSEGTLMEDKVHHYRVVDHSSTFADYPEATHCWNRTNAHSVSTKRNYKWDNSLYRHIADMLDFVEETHNEQYKQFVKNKIVKAKQLLENNDFKQI